jgi:exodeoxyribonuclease VII large subunit
LSAPNLLAVRRGALERLAGRLIHPREYIATQCHRAALLAQRLALAPAGALAAQRGGLERLSGRLVHPREMIAAQRNRMSLLGQRLANPLPGRLREAAFHVRALGARLEALSYAATLARGFALVTTDKGAAVTSAAKMPASAVIRFGDGEVAVRKAAKQGVLDL